MPDLMTASLLFGGQVCIFLTAAIGVIQGLRNKQAIQEVHLTVNSRLSPSPAMAAHTYYATCSVQIN